MADVNVNKVSMTEKQKVKEITDRLEEGLKELFEGEKYKMLPEYHVKIP